MFEHTQSALALIYFLMHFFYEYCFVRQSSTQKNLLLTSCEIFVKKKTFMTINAMLHRYLFSARRGNVLSTFLTFYIHFTWLVVFVFCNCQQGAYDIKLASAKFLSKPGSCP